MKLWIYGIITILYHMEWWKYCALNFFLDSLQRHERLNLNFWVQKKGVWEIPTPALPPPPTPGSNSVQNGMKKYILKKNGCTWTIPVVSPGGGGLPVQHPSPAAVRSLSPQPSIRVSTSVRFVVGHGLSCFAGELVSRTWASGPD